jgi:beta-mannosidase
LLCQSLSGIWQMRELNTDEWLPATVPGGTFADLMESGKIPDPFVARNEKRVQWVADRDWEYRREFEVERELLEEDRVELVCNGLDTLAEVTLNGRFLGKTDNMFRTHCWDVKEHLNEGNNTLAIVFRSPVAYIDSRQKTRKLPSIMNSGMAHLRKVQSHFGWDWGPRLPVSGIWREIMLEGFSTARLRDIHLRQLHEDGRVTVTARVDVERWGSADLVLRLSLTDPDGRVQRIESAVTEDGDAMLVALPVDSPQLWWPNGLGEQPLYQAEVVLSGDGQELERRVFQLGLRRLELRQETDEWGKTFTFVVNGVPLFARGANWIPGDSLPTRMTSERYERLIRDSAAANMNMLRVWGGGYYEDQSFYDMCDRYGILVWQDFMFACTPYPLDEAEFLENVRLEAQDVIRRLRHRACLALWCGNNELEMMWGLWKRHKSLTAACESFFHQQLPDWVAQLDPDRPYWPSSPSSGKFRDDTNGDARGDTHLWQVWHGLKPFAYYRSRFSRIASEFGMQALPALETLASFADSNSLRLNSSVMRHHQRSIGGNDKILYYLTDRFRLPRGFSDLVYLSQIQQAEAIRIGVEHFRRNSPRCSGALYWQYNDCWPVISWAGVDHAGRWKALQYSARRFNAPLALSLEHEGSSVRPFVANDTRERWQGTLRWSLETLEGERIESGTEEVTAAPLSVTGLRALDFSGSLRANGEARLVFVADLYEGEQRLAWQTVAFVPERKMSLPDPGLRWTVEQEDDQLTITLSSRSWARFVWLRMEGADIVFSDNFFDLPANWTVLVHCPVPAGWTVQQARDALRVRSLADVTPAGSAASDKLRHILAGLKPVSLLTRTVFRFLD